MLLARFIFPLLLGSSCLFGAEKSPAHRLLDAMDFESNSLSTSKAVFKAVFDQFQIDGLPAEILAEVSKEADRAFAKTFQDPEYQEAVAKIYDQKFTPEELEELIRFYETPVGRKFIKALSENSKEEELVGKKFLEKNAPEFETKIGEIMTKLLAEDNTETPADTDDNPEGK